MSGQGCCPQEGGVLHQHVSSSASLMLGGRCFHHQVSSSAAKGFMYTLPRQQTQSKLSRNTALYVCTWTYPWAPCGTYRSDSWFLVPRQHTHVVCSLLFNSWRCVFSLVSFFTTVFNRISCLSK